MKVAQWDLAGKFWWEVCFKCQQAVGKALKGYCYARGKRGVLGAFAPGIEPVLRQI